MITMQALTAWVARGAGEKRKAAAKSAAVPNSDPVEQRALL
jgi:hypothetical protein